MSGNKRSIRTKQDLILEVWRQLDSDSVGARELEVIQQAIRETFGEGAVESPASTARTLADDGALLRHPEVLDYDSKWRERISLESFLGKPLGFENLAEGYRAIRQVDSLRKQFEQVGDQAAIRRLRDLILRIKREMQLIARSKVVDERLRLEAGEMVQWLTVWLQDANLFLDWLSLRLQSTDFTGKIDFVPDDANDSEDRNL